MYLDPTNMPPERMFVWSCPNHPASRLQQYNYEREMETGDALVLSPGNSYGRGSGTAHDVVVVWWDGIRDAALINPTIAVIHQASKQELRCQCNAVMYGGATDITRASARSVPAAQIPSEASGLLLSDGPDDKIDPKVFPLGAEIAVEDGTLFRVVRDGKQRNALLQIVGKRRATPPQHRETVTVTSRGKVAMLPGTKPAPLCDIAVRTIPPGVQIGPVSRLGSLIHDETEHRLYVCTQATPNAVPEYTEIRTRDVNALYEQLQIQSFEASRAVAPTLPAPPTVAEALATDAADAAWRVAARQLLKLAREPLVALLGRHLGNGDATFATRASAFLETDLGAALLGSVLGVALGLAPAAFGPVVPRLAAELRRAAMHTASEAVVETLMEPLRAVLVNFVSAPAATPPFCPSLPVVPPPALEAGGDRSVLRPTTASRTPARIARAKKTKKS